ncbi:HK97 gp10 family phage protein [Pelagerythrobacter marinus]|nr:HK97 gp10 family phage protein [Pelagerythrobacter marinus]
MSKAFPVEGLKQLDAYLSALPKNMQTGAYRAGLTAAARVIRDEARLRAPRKSGKMAKAIRSGSPRRNEDGSFSISVALRGNDHAFLGLFFEYGVAPHYITAGGAPMSARKLTQAARREGSSDVATGALKIGGNYVTGAVLHPGIRPHPFLRPALDIKADEAVKAFAERTRAYIEGKTGFTAPLAEAA